MTRPSIRDLRRAHLSLGIGEIVAALVFCGAAAWVVGPRFENPADRVALWAALLPLIAVLLQAGIYWLAARSWVGRGGMPRAVRRVYLALRVVDVGLLGCGLGVVAIARPSSAAMLVLVVAVWLFGVVEYLNYFVVRLSYPAGRWLHEVTRWRTPRLAKDLR
ncbi:hypothetical protein [Microbacterium sp. 22242]|uniref:hypothetical protein n=1 Tax=Microbacterium sp. 22242 TaxID=3453896 RepID=UPI003F85A058